MTGRGAVRAVLLVGLAAGVAWGAWRWLFPDDDARIRAALDDAASRVSAAAGESAVAGVARLGGLRDAITDDVVVEGPGGLRLEGADRLIAAAAAGAQRARGARVRLSDLDVVRDPDGRRAEVHGVVEVSGAGEWDGRDAVFAMQQGDDGRWRIAGVTVLDPLERPAPAR